MFSCGRTLPLVLLGFLLFVGGCRSTSGDADSVEAQIPAVEVVQARSGTVPLRERMTGTVRASGEVAIYPQVAGPVVEVLAQNGDHVQKGDALVRIRAVGAQAQVGQAESAVEAAKAEVAQMEAQARELEAEYERNRALGKRGLVPLNTVDSLRAQAEAARAAARSAEAQLRVAREMVAEQRELQYQTVVRAPITGRVGQRNVEVGMRVDSQTALFVIGRLQNMRVEVPVAQDVVTRLRVGQRAELRPGGPASAAIEAEVSRISPFLEPGSFSAEVEIDIPNQEGSLVPGMFVTVDMFYGESRESTLVPVSALYEDALTGDRGMFVAAAPAEPSPAGADDAPAASTPPGPVSFRPVKVIAEGAQVVGVEGVQPGEWVVVVGQHLLDGRQQEGGSARARPIEWDRVLELQQLQREDLLRDFLERQRRTGMGG